MDDITKLANFIKRCTPSCISFSVTEKDLIPIRLKENWYTKRYENIVEVIYRSRMEIVREDETT